MNILFLTQRSHSRNRKSFFFSAFFVTQNEIQLVLLPKAPVQTSIQRRWGEEMTLLPELLYLRQTTAAVAPIGVIPYVLYPVLHIIVY